MDRCQDCGASRADGYLIAEGRRLECGPQGFEARIALLQIQAGELTGRAGAYDILD